MDIKKNPKSDLENFSKLFLQLGLVAALFITYVTIENKTYDKSNVEAFGAADMGARLEEETVMLAPPPPPPPPPPAQAPPPPPAPTKLDIKKDEAKVEETILQTTETEEDEKVETVDVEQIETVETVEEIVEDVPFAVIEEVPVFPGCTGSKEEKRKCLNQKMRRHVSRNFDAELANELGLDSGRKRIMVQFKIDKNGNVTNIRSRAPHPRLKKEAERIIKKLPKMKPGKQRGKPVGVKYTLP
ncbi:MAG: energy transducer TonB, partial [Polaribacter sp.]